jgi:hypothetical protein
MMYVVPKKTIVQSAKNIGSDQSNNTFIYALQVAKSFKEADLTPVFLYDPSEKQLIVTSKERIGNKFH